MLRSVIRNPVAWGSDGSTAMPRGRGSEVDEKAVVQFRVFG
jgi:hypothetical protein